MVLLAMTPAIVDALSRIDPTTLDSPNAPDLTTPLPGSPISHTQLILLSKLLKSTSLDNHNHNNGPTTLNALLQNTRPYTPPPPPKPAQTPEYTALMARLRAQQDLQTYTAMLNPRVTRDPFTQRYNTNLHSPSTSQSRNHDFSIGVDEPDDVSYDEVHRQIILIINVLISIVCVAVFVWVAARQWNVGKRLGLAMGSAVAVAVAEVVVYSGYVRKVHEAKAVEKKKPEIREIVASWVLEKGSERGADGEKEKDDGVRYRKGKHR